MRYHDLSMGEDALRIVNTVIEIPQSSGNACEYDAALDSCVLDRVFASPLCYPTDYGWIPGTLFNSRYDQVASLDDLPEYALREIHSLFTVCRHIDCEDTEIIREAVELHRSSGSRRH